MNKNIRTYHRDEVISFRKTNEKYGHLSNMAPTYPLIINGIEIKSVEALYQALRFPNNPEIQRMIIAENSPMTAKMKSKPFRNFTRPDWKKVRVSIMKWSLRVKLFYHYERFSKLLLSTEGKPIVEDSRKDDFWGAILTDDGSLFVGCNVLGRLLMELREDIKNGKFRDHHLIEPLNIVDFRLLNEEIKPISKGAK